MKYFLYSQTSRTSGVSDTNDKSVYFGDGVLVIDITKHPEKAKISMRPSYFEYKDGNIVEISDAKKLEVDNKSKNGSYIEILEKTRLLEERISYLEKKVALKV